MKFVRIGDPGKERPALLENGRLRDLEGVISDVSGDALCPASTCRWNWPSITWPDIAW